MTVKTYERIGELISNIKRSKVMLNRNKEMINKDFEALNTLLKKNDQPEMKLDDIKPSGKYDYEDEEF